MIKENVYSQIIERAKGRTLPSYKEKHHIIPKCLGGSNKKDKPWSPARRLAQINKNQTNAKRENNTSYNSTSELGICCGQY
jgi:hypothetical protein